MDGLLETSVDLDQLLAGCRRQIQTLTESVHSRIRAAGVVIDPLQTLRHDMDGREYDRRG